MKLIARRLVWLLPVMLCACAHNPVQTQMQAMAPPLEYVPPPPDISPTALPAPRLDIPKTPAPVAVPPEPVKTTPKHHRSVIKAAGPAAPTPAGGAPAQSGQPGQSGQAAESAPAEVSAIGQFGPPEPPDQKKQTENSINDIERGVNGIGRKLNDQDEKTIVQIREFLKQARADLASGDVVAAQTLATKAKALLGELSE